MVAMSAMFQQRPSQRIQATTPRTLPGNSSGESGVAALSLVIVKTPSTGTRVASGCLGWAP